jgi:hypothetical protein
MYGDLWWFNSEWHVLKDGSGFLLWSTREPCSRSWSYIAHIIASHIWPTLYRLDGPSCDICDSGKLMRKKDPHWIHRSDWLGDGHMAVPWLGRFLLRCWLQHGHVEVVAGSPCEEEAMNPFLARFSCCLRTLWIHVESQWMIIGSRCIKDLSFEHEVLRGCAMPSARLRLYQFFREQLPCCPWGTSQLSLVPKTVWEWWWWWCSGAIVFLWISYWEAPDEHRGGLTAIGRKNTSFWPRTHRLTGDQRATSDCGFCVLQLWI